jgi:hypothetical protein
MSEEIEDAAIAFLLRLDPATQREVLRRYEEVLQEELDTSSARLRRIAVALHQTTRTLGHPPSVREYKRLRDERPERGWPDQRSITRWLGVRSWNDALVRMGLTSVLDGDEIEGSIGPAYSIGEVIEAVRACAADLGRPPTITDYLAWQRRPDVRERPGRRPASTWVFNRIFGGFPPARVAAGLVEGDVTAAHPSDLLLRTANYRLSTEQIIQDIRDVAARTADKVTATVYDRERRFVYIETKALGKPRALAGVGSIYRHFGTWTAAVEAAGVTRPTTDRGRPPAFTDDALLEAVRNAASVTSDDLTISAYEQWRENERDGNSEAPPTYTTIHRRFGGFPQAMKAAGLRPSRRRRRSTLWTEDQLAEAVQQAVRAWSGTCLTVSRYSEWRTRRLASSPNRHVPSVTSIVRHFGSWLRAIEVALDGDDR